MPTIISIKITDSNLIPTFELHCIPVDIIKYIIMVQIKHYHVMSIGPYFPSTHLRIFDDKLHISLSVTICIYPINNQISLATVNTISIAIYK